MGEHLDCFKKSKHDFMSFKFFGMDVRATCLTSLLGCFM